MVFDREFNKGYLRFSHPSIADRAYSLYNKFTFTNGATLDLQMYQDDRLDPQPKSELLIISNLPDYFDENKLYDVFRPYGPLNLCRCVMKDDFYRGDAYIQFFLQADSDEAKRCLKGHMIDGLPLSIQVYMPSKIYASKEEVPEMKENSVDILNLYIKNLEPEFNSQDLTNLFSKFGRIISARVMTNPATRQSKGYGFVSFSKSEDAATALHEMNGYTLGNRQLLVAYHEPRKGKSTVHSNNSSISNNNNNSSSSNNNNNSSSSSISNSNHMNHFTKPMNDMGLYTSYSPNNIHNQHMSPSFNVQSSYISDTNHQQHSMRSINTINGLGLDNMDQLGMNMNIKDLSVGKVLHKSPMNGIPKRKMSDVNLPIQLHKLSPHTSPISTGAGKSLVTMASGLSVQKPPAHLSLPQQNRLTLRRRGSLESVMTESSSNLQRQKLEKAVNQCGDYGKTVHDIVEMLLTLKRKERSLCLFNPDFLKDKIEHALEALAVCNDSESEESEGEGEVDTMEELMKRNEISLPAYSYPSMTPITPTPSTAPTPVPTAISDTPTYYAEKQPLIKVESDSESSDESTHEETQEPEFSKEIDALLSSLEGKAVHEKKQLLGDKLFPLVKATGIKQAPKVTIFLLDSVDLYELAHEMYDTRLLMPRVQKAFNALQSH
ncbi:hypothetical protein BDB01DRAFT_807685 [Pilobolus umbonatus]|nr:hypothetical protein BDB01DRAFT_807685 [Pilobolus umbonatus]